MRSSVYISLAYLVLVAPAEAVTITVPGQQPTIQAGLNACSPGDTVLVAPGTYLENIIWPPTQSIVLKSESGPESTVIDGGNPSHPDTGSVVVFNAGQDQSTVLDGFTITNGSGTLLSFPAPIYRGGGIWLYNASATIIGNIISGNDHSRIGLGAGIASEDSSPIISGNRISNNRALEPQYGYGGGIFCGGIACYPCSAIITDNEISENTARWGAGITAADSSPIIDTNEISSNTADNGGGILFLPGFPTSPGSAPVITGNTIRYNIAGVAGGISGYGPTGDQDPHISGNIILENTGGGIVLDAMNGSISAVIESCVISDNSPCGMRLTNAATPRIEHCLVSHNNGTGIVCQLAAKPTIHYCDFLDHAPYYGVSNSWSGITIDAELNWWGHGSGPTHPGNPGGLGDRVSDYVDYTPWSTSSGVAEPVSGAPGGWLALEQNRPNPFNPTTEISYSVPSRMLLNLRIYDVGGRMVRSLVDGVADPGVHTVSWDGRDASGASVPSGIYYLRLAGGGLEITRAMTLVK